MPDKVSVLRCTTTLDIPAERVLQAAAAVGLDGCVVVGYDKDGEIYLASTMAGSGDMLWLFEKAKALLMER